MQEYRRRGYAGGVCKEGEGVCGEGEGAGYACIALNTATKTIPHKYNR